MKKLEDFFEHELKEFPGIERTDAWKILRGDFRKTKGIDLNISEIDLDYYLRIRNDEEKRKELEESIKKFPIFQSTLEKALRITEDMEHNKKVYAKWLKLDELGMNSIDKKIPIYVYFIPTNTESREGIFDLEIYCNKMCAESRAWIHSPCGNMGTEFISGSYMGSVRSDNNMFSKLYNDLKLLLGEEKYPQTFFTGFLYVGKCKNENEFRTLVIDNTLNSSQIFHAKKEEKNLLKSLFKRYKINQLVLLAKEKILEKTTYEDGGLLEFEDIHMTFSLKPIIALSATQKILEDTDQDTYERMIVQYGLHKRYFSDGDAGLRKWMRDRIYFVMEKRMRECLV